MPSIILAVFMFAAGVAAGWLYFQERTRLIEEDLKATLEELDSLKRSYRTLKGNNYKLYNELYYKRVAA